MRPETAPEERGFTLIETVVALAVLLLTLTLGAAFFWQQPLVHERLDRQREAWDTIESTLEAIRAGDLPLIDDEVALDGGVLRIDVAPTAVQDLFEVSAEVSYEVRGQPFVRRSTTRVWWRQP